MAASVSGQTMFGEKTPMSIVITGDAGSGKTTVTNRLMCMSGATDRRTTNASPKKFETAKYDITIADAPSHRDFIKSGIIQPAKVDCAVLVVSACLGAFETSMSRDGRAREYVLLAYTMGVRQLIVVVNKMDADDVSYSEERFHRIRTEVSSYVVKVGYSVERVSFVPISARQGDNVFEPTDRMPWFKEWTVKRKEGIVTDGTLVQALDAISVPHRPIDKPFRLSVQDVYKVAGIGIVVAGRVETGVLRQNMVVKFTPSNITTTVRSIAMHHTSLERAVPGDNIGFSVGEVSVKDVRRGFVCSDAHNEPAQQAASFIAKVIVLKHPNQLASDYTAILTCHMANIRCRFVELLEKIDRRTDKIIEVCPKSLQPRDTALVKIVPLEPICVETFDRYPSLGRFAVRDKTGTVAVGCIKEIETVTFTIPCE